MLNVFFMEMLKTREMLNMLNVWVFMATFSPEHLTYLTYLTFPQFRALFSGRPPNTFNIFNISPVLSSFQKEHLTFPLFREHRVTKQGKC